MLELPENALIMFLDGLKPWVKLKSEWRGMENIFKALAIVDNGSVKLQKRKQRSSKEDEEKEKTNSNRSPSPPKREDKIKEKKIFFKKRKSWRTEMLFLQWATFCQ